MSELDESKLFWKLDADGNAVQADGVVDWAFWFENTNRVLAHDVIGDVLVSTMFFGIDLMASFNDGPPDLWETRVFGGSHDGRGNRYPTREEGLKGHRLWCDRVRAER